MGKYKQRSDSKGSLKDIQCLINNKSNCELLNNKIKSILKLRDDVIWESPLKGDNYAEYRDHDFIKKLGLENKIKVPLEDFWPSKGPQWDGLGKTSDAVFLIEAKAHITEIISPSSRASGSSLSQIKETFGNVRKYLGIKNDIDWSNRFYQYTNRIAHLYYLNVLNKINAYLVNIYFVNDRAVKGPESESEWKGALLLLNNYLGINNHKLKKRILDIFINICTVTVFT